MAFVKLDKGPRGTFNHGEPEVRMGAHLQTAKGTHRGVYFSFSQELVEQVGWKVTRAISDKRDACVVDVQEGVGEDAGFLLIAESEDGYSLGTTSLKSQSFSMSVSAVKLKHYVLNEMPVPTEPVEFTIDAKEKTILIQCPDWLRYNSLSYVEPPKPEAPPPRPTQDARQGVKELVKAAAKDALPDRNRKHRRAVVAATVRALQ